MQDINNTDLEKEAAERYPMPNNLQKAIDEQDDLRLAFNTEEISLIYTQRRAYIAGRTASSNEEKIWNAALTLANNMCVQISDIYNNDDEIEKADVANECAKAVRGEIGQYSSWSAELQQPAASSTISEGQGEAFDKGYLRGVAEAEEKYLGKSVPKSVLNRNEYLSQLSEGTAKGGKEGIFLSNAEITKLKEEHFQLTQKIEQLSSQEAKAIAEKAMEEARKYFRRCIKLEDGKTVFDTLQYECLKAEYLSQFTSPSSPVKE